MFLVILRIRHNFPTTKRTQMFPLRQSWVKIMGKLSENGQYVCETAKVCWTKIWRVHFLVQIFHLGCPDAPSCHTSDHHGLILLPLSLFVFPSSQHSFISIGAHRLAYLSPSVWTNISLLAASLASSILLTAVLHSSPSLVPPSK